MIVSSVFKLKRRETAMLIFIGLGLYDERDISVKGLDAIRAADLVYAEFYTSRLMGAALETLEEFYGRRVHLLSRKQVEVDPAWMEDALDKDVAFLVGAMPWSPLPIWTSRCALPGWASRHR